VLDEIGVDSSAILGSAPQLLSSRVDALNVQLRAVLCCVAVCLQVLDEIGVDLSAILGSAPQRQAAQKQPAQAAAAATGDSELEDLQARLAMLRS
jgi:hypothetical protein